MIAMATSSQIGISRPVNVRSVVLCVRECLSPLQETGDCDKYQSD